MTNDTTRVGKISQQMITNLDTKKIQLGCKLTLYKAVNVCSELVDFNFGVFLRRCLAVVLLCVYRMCAKYINRARI